MGAMQSCLDNYELQSILANGSTESAFLQAVIDDDVPRLKEMVHAMDEVDRAKLADMVILEGCGMLEMASSLSQMKVCKYLVEELGFDVNLGGFRGGPTPLAAAAVSGEFISARYLLDHGANPNKIDGTGFAALHAAAKNGNEAIVRLLLSRGATVDIAGVHGTPLHTAASYGNPGALKILLDHHADPNGVSEVSGTPIATALDSTKHGLSESISLHCVKLLVKAGADVNSANPDTPLVVATKYGLADCIKYLLEAGADPNIPDKEHGRLPLQIAASFGKRSLVEILFPFTSPIRAVANWSVQGIIAHQKSRCSIPKKPRNKTMDKIADLKSQGKNAVKRKDYLGASKLYSEALELDNCDATLYSNRSLCYVQIGKSQKALLDADVCIARRPNWVKGYYRKGAAHMSLKEHKKAVEAFLDGLKLDPGNAEIEKVLWESLEAMKKDHAAAGNLQATD
ncbi:hypothetical protein QYE76_063060 [Lolium multiflorum]|uniref:Ankyrin repeat family protein n=1 Tax=Lolium multiflorum TaxID=4521 RepID=A0AAD8S6D1_LOLMU|nr:hypothetical protein QYE76_063060 [Lolium multiflorum]